MPIKNTMNINYKKLPKVNLHKSEEDNGRS